MILPPKKRCHYKKKGEKHLWKKHSNNNNIMSGICTIYETEDEEDYETDVEFKFDKKEGKLISLSSPNRDFTKIELAVIEEMLRDNIKVNF